MNEKEIRRFIGDLKAKRPDALLMWKYYLKVKDAVENGYRGLKIDPSSAFVCVGFNDKDLGLGMLWASFLVEIDRKYGFSNNMFKTYEELQTIEERTQNEKQRTLLDF